MGDAPDNAEYVVLTADPTLTAERILTGTANQVIVTDGGAGNAVTLSGGAVHPTDAQLHSPQTTPLSPAPHSPRPGQSR